MLYRLLFRDRNDGSFGMIGWISKSHSEYNCSIYIKRDFFFVVAWYVFLPSIYTIRHCFISVLLLFFFWRRFILYIILLEFFSSFLFLYFFLILHFNLLLVKSCGFIVYCRAMKQVSVQLKNFQIIFRNVAEIDTNVFGFVQNVLKLCSIYRTNSSRTF